MVSLVSSPSKNGSALPYHGLGQVNFLKVCIKTTSL